MLQKDKQDIFLDTVSVDKWVRIGSRKRAGALAPLFSVYSKDSLGIGDFRDLRLLVDWAKSSANSIIQLLPMNETGATNCPYDSLSSFALEPLYICLSEIPAAANPKIVTNIKRLKESFPAGLPYVDYRIKKEKVKLLWELFTQYGIDNQAEFDVFLKDNSYWIQDFSLYKVLKDFHQGRPWYEWEEGYRNRDKAALEEFSTGHKKEIVFQIWMQWIAYKQFCRVKLYAQGKEVLIKGDLPVLVSRDSADVWAHPEFFKLSLASGAPPDMYCAKGQRWGMPPYNWDVISADGYRYIKEKLKFAENFYDILRIDHVVGLFRLWSIPHNDPEENKGLNGFFDPPQEGIWGEHGRRILSVMLKETKMLLCSEDLGTIPRVCPQTLKELGIPGNDIQRWAKDWEVRHDFLAPQEYRELSVAALSTHDTTIWANWWNIEAGTIDEALFMCKCGQRGIDYKSIKDKLFNIKLSKYGRLRWLNSVSSEDELASILCRDKKGIADFIDMYKNTFGEKEKLWKLLEFGWPMREEADPEIVEAVLKFTFTSRAIFAIQSIFDYLSMDKILKGDLYKYRFNTPGTISDKNWSLVIPISLEDLLRNKITAKIKKLIIDSGR